MQLTIPPQNIDALTDEIARLNRKATRLGLPPIRIAAVSGTYADQDGYPVLDVTVDGAIPQFGGWSFGATVEPLESGRVIFHGPLAAEVPERFQTLGTCCEHCGSRRQRTHLYALKSEAGEWLQVGQSCIKDFLGGASLAAFEWRPSEALEQLEERLVRDARDNSLCVELTVAHAVREVKLHGFVPTSADRDLTSTSGRVSLALGERVQITDEERATARAILGHFAGREKNGNSYLDKLTDLAACRFAHNRNQAVLVSAVTAYDRELAARAELANLVESEHIGNVGERLDFTVTVKRNITLPDYGYGESTLLIMEDLSGNRLTWKSSRALDTEQDEQLKLKGTVKAHGDYKGVKQTVLTRCKFLG